MRTPLPQRLYRLALHAYPATFRARYAEEMELVFNEGLRVARAAGPVPVLRYHCITSLDLIGSALRQRFASMNKMPTTVALIAITLGCFATYVDFHASEVQATLLVILAGGFALGCAAPRRAWLWALLIAVWLPAGQVAAFALRANSAQAHPYVSRILILLPALAAAFAGAYAGVCLRFACRVLAPSPERRND